MESGFVGVIEDELWRSRLRVRRRRWRCGILAVELRVGFESVDRPGGVCSLGGESVVVIGASERGWRGDRLRKVELLFQLICREWRVDRRLQAVGSRHHICGGVEPRSSACRKRRSAGMLRKLERRR